MPKTRIAKRNSSYRQARFRVLSCVDYLDYMLVKNEAPGFRIEEIQPLFQEYVCDSGT
jgi:hypothetical protein